MYEIVVHEGAEEDLNAAAQYYESRETDLGEEFLKELTLTFRRIRERPLPTAQSLMSTTAVCSRAFRMVSFTGLRRTESWCLL